MAIQATADAPQKQKPSIPSTMRAAALDRFGGPEVLTIHDLPVPTLDANEILIAVHTAGVGPWDAAIAPKTIPDHLRSPYRIYFLAIGSVGGNAPLFDAGATVEADWPNMNEDIPESAVI